MIMNNAFSVSSTHGSSELHPREGVGVGALHSHHTLPSCLHKHKLCEGRTVVPFVLVMFVQK